MMSEELPHLTDGLRSLLATYRQLMQNERHWELTRQTLSWSMAHTSRRLSDAFYTQEAFVSATFGFYCSPGWARFEHILIGARSCVVFAKADEASGDELDAFVTRLSDDDGSCGRVATEVFGELATSYTALISELQQYGCDTATVQVSVLEMCTAMQREKACNRSTITEDEYRQIRGCTIGVPYYAKCWESTLGLRFSEQAARSFQVENTLGLVAELVYISNDLGSLERDEAASCVNECEADLNLVLLRTRNGSSRQAAISETVDLYNHRVRQLDAIFAALSRSEPWAEAAVRSYVDVLGSIVNGNLSAMKLLIQVRYPGSKTRLDQLRFIAPITHAASL